VARWPAGRVLEDERRARVAYPQLVLLGTWFAIGEQAGGRWSQPWLQEHASLAAARTSLVSYFREYVPAWETPGPLVCAAYAEAADALERDEASEITAAGAPVPHQPDRAPGPDELRQARATTAIGLRPLPPA